VELLRARRENPYALVINDPRPLASVDDIWSSAAQLATIGIFVLLLGAAFYVCRPVLLPILAAMVIGTTLGPLVKLGADHNVPPWLTSLNLTLLLVAAAALLVTLIAGPVAEWIGRAPEIGESIKQKLYVLDRPLAALSDLQKALMPAPEHAVTVESSRISMVTPVVAFVTPAAAQLVVFLATLIFFLAGQLEFRRYATSLFASRDAKLRFIRIANDIEHNLASYLAVVTVINVALGVIVAVGAWAFGFPNPIIFGILAALLNYIPYIGPGCMAIILLGVGLVTFPSLGLALAAPASFVALTTIEGHLITPTILGRRLTLNPLVVLIALAFWTWLWGPVGAFLAVPLSIVGLVTINHLFPDDDPKLPE
jgi:predicted PurR-regulated permease PerM